MSLIHAGKRRESLIAIRWLAIIWAVAPLSCHEQGEAQRFGDNDHAISVTALISSPDVFDGESVFVIGTLLWTGEEPVLYADEMALANFDSRRSIRLEPESGVFGANLNRQSVIVGGDFFYSRDFAEEHPTYKGVLRVKSIEKRE